MTGTPTILRDALDRRDNALIRIIDLCADEPGCDLASCVAALAREALGWEKE